MPAQASTGDLNWATAFSPFTLPLITMSSWFEVDSNIHCAFRYKLSLTLFEGSAGEPQNL
jgi:hypothetical protein